MFKLGKNTANTCSAALLGAVLSTSACTTIQTNSKAQALKTIEIPSAPPQSIVNHLGDTSTTTLRVSTTFQNYSDTTDTSPTTHGVTATIQAPSKIVNLTQEDAEHKVNWKINDAPYINLAAWMAGPKYGVPTLELGDGFTFTKGPFSLAGIPSLTNYQFLPLPGKDSSQSVFAANFTVNPAFTVFDAGDKGLNFTLTLGASAVASYWASVKPLTLDGSTYSPNQSYINGQVTACFFPGSPLCISKTENVYIFDAKGPGLYSVITITADASALVKKIFDELAANSK